MLKLLKLSYLHLHYNWTPTPGGIKITPERIATDPMVIYLKQMDYDTIAKRIALAAPSLNYTFLDFLGHKEPAYYQRIPAEYFHTQPPWRLAR